MNSKILTFILLLLTSDIAFSGRILFNEAVREAVLGWGLDD